LTAACAFSMEPKVFDNFSIRSWLNCGTSTSSGALRGSDFKRNNGSIHSPSVRDCPNHLIHRTL